MAYRCASSGRGGDTFRPASSDAERMSLRAGGSALVVLDGCLVEELHVHAARRVLALGEAVEASEAEA